MGQKFSLGEDWKEGLKMGLEIAKQIALKQGYEITFPDVDKIIIKQEKRIGVVCKR